MVMVSYCTGCFVQVDHALNADRAAGLDKLMNDKFKSDRLDLGSML